MEPSVALLHEFTGAQTWESAVYDLMEPFRFLGDLTTIQAFESNVLDLKDFHFTGDDYSYKIEIEAKRSFLQLLKGRFNSGVEYNGKAWNWDTLIQVKTQELARFLLGESDWIDFNKPVPVLIRSDSLDLRNRVLELSMVEAQRLGIGKSTLHYLRKRTDIDKSFKIYLKVAGRLGSESLPLTGKRNLTEPLKKSNMLKTE